MTISDPLIRDIKGHILKFLNDVKESEYISDTNSNLLLFCENLETIFTCGLLPSLNAFGFIKSTDAWTWLEKIATTKDNTITFGYISSVESVKCYQNILTNVGKFRLLIRYCLNRKSLHVPVEYLLKNKSNTYYKENSILSDEILSEILFSLLLQCSEIAFKLDHSNIAFLDVTWILPEILKLELVPCKNLGLTLSFVMDKAVILYIESNSVVAETNKVEVGDVLYNVNGLHINRSARNGFSSLIRNNKGRPTTITIIKAKSSTTNESYPPIVTLLKQTNIPPVLAKRKGVKTNADLIENSKSGVYKATYVGFVNTGTIGNKNQIDRSVRFLLNPHKSQSPPSDSKHEVIKKVVYFQVGEIGVNVVDEKTSQVILKHSYMEISSCGSVQYLPNYFAYIAGNSYCNQSTDFNCHIFHIQNINLTHNILQSIGQGFQRTHFAV